LFGVSATVDLKFNNTKNIFKWVAIILVFTDFSRSWPRDLGFKDILSMPFKRAQSTQSWARRPREGADIQKAWTAFGRFLRLKGRGTFFFNFDRSKASASQ